MNVVAHAGAIGRRVVRSEDFATRVRSRWRRQAPVESDESQDRKVNYHTEGTQYGNARHPNYQIEKNVDFSLFTEDKGKYLVKVSDLSATTPE